MKIFGLEFNPSEIEDNPNVHVFLINTGSMGGPKDIGPCDITIEDSTSLIIEAVRDNVVWEPSIFGEGYEGPQSVPGVDMSRFDPHKYYSQGEIDRIRRELLESNRDWMSQFKGKL